MTPWTVALQAPLSMGFLRQKYWSGLPFPSPGGLPDPGIEFTPPASLPLADGFFSHMQVMFSQRLVGPFAGYCNSLFLLFFGISLH